MQLKLRKRVPKIFRFRTRTRWRKPDLTVDKIRAEYTLIFPKRLLLGEGKKQIKISTLESKREIIIDFKILFFIAYVGIMIPKDLRRKIH